MRRRTIFELTIGEISEAARRNSDKYVDRAKNIAENAFKEGVVWAMNECKGNNAETK